MYTSPCESVTPPSQKPGVCIILYCMIISMLCCLAICNILLPWPVRLWNAVLIVLHLACLLWRGMFALQLCVRVCVYAVVSWSCVWPYCQCAGGWTSSWHQRCPTKRHTCLLDVGPCGHTLSRHRTLTCVYLYLLDACIYYVGDACVTINHHRCCIINSSYIWWAIETWFPRVYTY